MLVTCCAYYALDYDLIPDHVWQERAWELAELQAEYGWGLDFYDDVFHDWDGSTGYHVRRDPEIVNVAQRLVNYAHREKRHPGFPVA